MGSTRFAISCLGVACGKLRSYNLFVEMEPHINIYIYRVKVLGETFVSHFFDSYQFALPLNLTFLVTGNMQLRLYGIDVLSRQDELFEQLLFVLTVLEGVVESSPLN